MFWHHDLYVHIFADDTKLYISVSVLNKDESAASLVCPLDKKTNGVS